MLVAAAAVVLALCNLLLGTFVICFQTAGRNSPVVTAGAMAILGDKNQVAAAVSPVKTQNFPPPFLNKRVHQKRLTLSGVKNAGRELAARQKPHFLQRWAGRLGDAMSGCVARVSLLGYNKHNCEDFRVRIRWGKVVDVYDGDTLTILARSGEGFPWHRPVMHKVRFAGIDTPELRSSGPKERKRAEQARDALARRVLNRVVKLMNVRREKYGRLLADVVVDGEVVNDWMVAQNYAVVYDGQGPKKNWEK
eukprot:TRINITY_DN14070_c2_g1_i1.p1 TRINITY_DN14070_c2_g1~~TRINITY_DN14070_c2_g1_i1.p1  ORF type:complete len:250 (-),score=8.51 TRINITY_DN14070_c2_g1_i1:314-1063(-)